MLTNVLAFIVSLLALVAILPIINKSFRYYLVRECYSAQIEGSALLGFRYGYTGFGLAYWPLARTIYADTLWMPRLHLTLCSHSGRMAQYEAFRLGFGRRTVGYLTRGDVTKNASGVYDVGFFYQRHGARRPWFSFKRLSVPATAMILACAALALPSCALLPPAHGTPPTAKQAAIAAKMQTIADALRHIEGADMTAQQALAFLDTYTAGIDDLVPYMADARLALKVAYAAGGASATGLEALARRYDA